MATLPELLLPECKAPFKLAAQIRKKTYKANNEYKFFLVHTEA